MERNDGPDAAGRGGTPEANEFSGSGSQPIDSFDFSGSVAMADKPARSEGIVDQPASRGGVREKLADVLQSSAERLRERGARSGDANPDTSSATFAGATGGG